MAKTKLVFEAELIFVNFGPFRRVAIDFLSGVGPRSHTPESLTSHIRGLETRNIITLPKSARRSLKARMPRPGRLARPRPHLPFLCVHACRSVPWSIRLLKCQINLGVNPVLPLASNARVANLPNLCKSICSGVKRAQHHLERRVLTVD